MSGELSLTHAVASGTERTAVRPEALAEAVVDSHVSGAPAEPASLFRELHVRRSIA